MLEESQEQEVQGSSEVPEVPTDHNIRVAETATQEFPQLFIWGLNPPAPDALGDPAFIAIALNEDVAREAVARNQEAAELMALREDVLALIAGPPTQVHPVAEGWAIVIASRSESEAA